MYSDLIIHYLEMIKVEDRVSPKRYNDCIMAGYGMQRSLMLINNDSVLYSVVGSPYLMAMTKWLQQELLVKNIKTLKQYNISDLVLLFDLPAYKRQDALLILELIQQVSYES